MISNEYTGKIVPPFTDKTSQMISASIFSKLKKLALMIFTGAFFGVIAFGIGNLFDITWIQYAGILIGGIFVLIGIYIAFTAKIAPCPYCNSTPGNGAFDTISNIDENEQIECDNCFEWLMSNKGEIRAFTEDDAKQLKEFEGPVFNNGIWPSECIACGETPTHTKEVKNALSQLLIGRLSVASGSIKGIHYCDKHNNEVLLNIRDDYLRIVFPDFNMLRRYLSVNSKRNKEPVKIK